MPSLLYIPYWFTSVVLTDSFTYLVNNFTAASSLILGLCIIYWIFPLILRYVAKHTIQKIFRLKIVILKLGFKSLSFSVISDDNVLLTIKFEDICLVPTIFSKSSRTYFSLYCNQILIEDVSINYLSDIYTKTKNFKIRKKKSRVNWSIFLFKFISFQIANFKLNLRLADLEKPPQIILQSKSCEFFIVPDKNRYLSQLKFDNFSGKVVCPNLSDSTENLLANLKTFITIDLIFSRKPNIVLYKFFLTIGETKFAVLEEIFHELAQITKQSIHKPIYYESVQKSKEPKTLSSYFKRIPKECGVDIGKLEMSLIRLSVSRNLNVTWSKCYASLLQPNSIDGCKKNDVNSPYLTQSYLPSSSSFESLNGDGNTTLHATNSVVSNNTDTDDSAPDSDTAEELVKFKTGCYGLNISRSMCTATSWRRVELSGQLDVSSSGGGLWLKCRVDNPCLIINIDELVFWRELAGDANQLYYQLLNRKKLKDNSEENKADCKKDQVWWPQVHFGLKLEVNCSHRGQSINADSQAVIQIVNNSNDTLGLEFGLKTLVASYEADSSYLDPEKFLQSIDLYSDINTGYCRLLTESQDNQKKYSTSSKSRNRNNADESTSAYSSPTHNQYTDYYHKWYTIGFTGNVFLWLHRNRAGCLMNQIQLELSHQLTSSLNYISSTLTQLHVTSNYTNTLHPPHHPHIASDNISNNDSSYDVISDSPSTYDNNAVSSSVNRMSRQSTLWKAISILDLEMKLEHVDIFSVSSHGAFIRQKVCIIQVNKTHNERMDIFFKSCFMDYDVILNENDLYSTKILFGYRNNQDNCPNQFTPYYQAICSIEEIRMEFYPELKNLTLFCDRSIHFNWDTAVHLTLVEFYDCVSGILINFKRMQKLVTTPKPQSPSIPAPVSSSNSNDNTNNTTDSPSSSNSLNFLIELRADLKLNTKLTNNKHISLYCDSLTYVVTNQRLKFASNNLIVFCDDNPIFTLQNFSWRSIVPTNKYRKDTERLKLTDAFNRAWEIQADRFLIIFPYKYNFHECYSEFVTVRKFVKLINNLRKTKVNWEDSSTRDDNSEVNNYSDIPPDYIVYFKEFQLEIKDDPFECQLLDNYLVLKDENEEHEKRIIRLRNQLRKMMKSGRTFKESEYQRCLVQLDLQKQTQYMSRISSIRASSSNSNNNNNNTNNSNTNNNNSSDNNLHGPPGTSSNANSATNSSSNNLLRWTIRNLSLMSLSDTGLYGEDNAIRHIRSIDIDSPYPENGLRFSTLWCRMINLNADHWIVQMRDYTKPMWEIRDMYVWGRLILADQASNEFAKRTVIVNPGKPWKEYRIERSTGTLKFFHDFSADMREHVICYGPNWEPCMQWINICLERINRPSRDPSPPLPWWDKNRLRLHGKLYFIADMMHWYYPVSLDPFNTTEFFQWQWSNVRVNWENMKWVLDGDLGIFCRSGSKYDGDCQLLHWPNLKLNIGIDWLCIGDPNDHFSIQPVHADNVKDPSRHDTYHKFRSRNVNLIIEMKESRSGVKECPRCVFYTNIIKFFEKFKTCVRKVARPIRRGKYFQHFRKRKIPLGRHFKFVNVKLSVPQLNLVYWVSLAKKSGVHMVCGPLTISSSLKLDIIPYPQTLLKRRSLSSWTVIQLKCQVKSGRVWLLMENNAATNNNGGNITTSNMLTREDASIHQRLNFYNTEYNTRDLFHNKHRFEFIIISNLRYDRVSESKKADFKLSYNSSILNDSNENNFEGLIPRHNLKLVDMRVRWTETNRNLVYSMIDIYRHKTQLRKNLSAQALKSIKLQLTTSNPTTTTQQQQTNNAAKFAGINPNGGAGIAANSGATNSNLLPGTLVLPEEKYGSDTNLSNIISGGEFYGEEDIEGSIDNCAGFILNDPSNNAGNSIGLTSGHSNFIHHQRKRSISAHCIAGTNNDNTSHANSNNLETRSNNFASNSNNDRQSFDPISTNPMLEQLVREADTARVYAYCDEEPKVGDVVDKLMGVQLSTSNPKIAWNWHLELINSQVMLKTDQLTGYVIVSAATTRLDSYDHMPLWKDSQLLTKSSLCGKLECMQYYATVGKVNPSSTQQWLNTCDVEDVLINEDVLSGTPEVVGCGRAVGGVVSGCVGPTTTTSPNTTRDNVSLQDFKPTNSSTLSGATNTVSNSSISGLPNTQESIQLQRMISKCSCNVYYISYDIADPNVLPQHLVPPLPLEEDEMTSSTEGSTVLTIVHSNLNVCTNSLQYHMVVDIINDLILYVEPHRKARDDRYKVEFSLLSIDQLKHTILHSQENLRNLVHYQMKLERELWKVCTERQISRIRVLESTIKQVKTEIEQKNSALTQCIAIYQQWHVQSQRKDINLNILSSSTTGPVTSTNATATVAGSISSTTVANVGACFVTNNANNGDGLMGSSLVSNIVVDGAGCSGAGETQIGEKKTSYSSDISSSKSQHSYPHYHYHQHKQTASDLSQITTNTSNGSNSSAAALTSGQSTNTALKSSGAPRELRRNEVCFEHATWRMTENDGQIGLCDVELRGFIYNKLNYDDDDYLTGRHTFELATVKVESLINMSVFHEVLTLDSESLLSVGGPVLRIYVNEGVPVGGIKVNQSIEVSIAPLVLRISKLFYSTMMPFFFPGKNETTQPPPTLTTTSTTSTSNESTSSFTRTTTNSSTNTIFTLTNSNSQENTNVDWVSNSQNSYRLPDNDSMVTSNSTAISMTTNNQSVVNIIDYDESPQQQIMTNMHLDTAETDGFGSMFRPKLPSYPNIKMGTSSRSRTIPPPIPATLFNLSSAATVAPHSLPLPSHATALSSSSSHNYDNNFMTSMNILPSPGSLDMPGTSVINQETEDRQLSPYGAQGLKIDELSSDNVNLRDPSFYQQSIQTNTNTNNRNVTGRSYYSNVPADVNIDNMPGNVVVTGSFNPQQIQHGTRKFYHHQYTGSGGNIQSAQTTNNPMQPSSAITCTGQNISTTSANSPTVSAPFISSSFIGPTTDSNLTGSGSNVAVSNDPLQLMAERAKQNSMFHYVSISGFPIRLSYRGEKQNALSINNIALNVTQIQFHNKLWTWLDLVMEVKKSIYKQLKFEIIKQKFKIKRRPLSAANNPSIDLKVRDDDIKLMLLGEYALPPEKANTKKKGNLFKKILSKK